MPRGRGPMRAQVRSVPRKCASLGKLLDDMARLEPHNPCFQSVRSAAAPGPPHGQQPALKCSFYRGME